MSSVFFLTNRLGKSIIGLAEFDRAISKVEKIGKISLEQKENQELCEGFTQDLQVLLIHYLHISAIFDAHSILQIYDKEIEVNLKLSIEIFLFPSYFK
ncbi:MAG: hypothetical protein ACJ72Q_16610 [Nitrososphaeraceae archaeon]